MRNPSLLLFLLAVLLLLSATDVSAQSRVFTGKPRYAIDAVRLDDTGRRALGRIEVEMFPAIAPNHVRNWDSLVTLHFYDSTAFHRVIPGFMIQGGDPNSRSGDESTWGRGDPEQLQIEAEFSTASHQRGILSAARTADPNSATSQFFICVAPAVHLDRNYTIYGHVTSGMNIADTIVKSPRDGNDRPNNKIEMFVSYLGSNDIQEVAPTLHVPTIDSYQSNQIVRLAWNKVLDAMTYHLTVASDSAFQNIVLDSGASQIDTSSLIQDLDPLARYYWRVEANNGGDTAMSQVQEIEVGPAGAKLLLPANNSSTVSVTPTLQWEAAPSAVLYRVQVAQSATFTKAQIKLDTFISATSVAPRLPLSVGTKYYWRVQGFSNNGPGYFSDVRNFRPSAATVGSLASKNLSIESVSPNPSSGDLVNIEYALATAGHSRISIYDCLGREVMLVKDGFSLEGEHSMSFDAKQLAASRYFVVVRNGSSSVSRAFVKIP